MTIKIKIQNYLSINAKCKVKGGLTLAVGKENWSYNVSLYHRRKLKICLN